MHAVWMLMVFVMSFTSLIAHADKDSVAANQKAIDIFNEYLVAEPMRSSMIRLELDRQKPDVPVFVEYALRKIVEDQSENRPYPERRKFYLLRLGSLITRSLPWEKPEELALKNSIHQSLQKLLLLYADDFGTQSEIFSIYNQLDLWNGADVPYLFRQVFIEKRQSDEFAEKLLQLAPQANDKDKYSMSMSVRKNYKDLMGSALLFRMGSRESKDLLWLIVRLTEWQSIRFASFTDRRPMPAYLALIAKDLHDSLHNGEKPVLEAYNRVRRSRGREGSAEFSEAEVAAGRQFLRDLWSGQLFSSCEDRLRLVK